MSLTSGRYCSCAFEISLTMLLATNPFMSSLTAFPLIFGAHTANAVLLTARMTTRINFTR